MTDELKPLILHYLAGREFISTGEINQFCARKFPDVQDFILYFDVYNTIKDLAAEKLIECVEIDNHLWVKRR